MDFLIVLILATWRISSLLVNEDGPYNLFERFRYAVGVRFTPTGIAYGDNIIAELLTCVWCLSFWIGLILMIGYSFYPNQTILACLPFALSAGAIMVNKWTQ